MDDRIILNSIKKLLGPGDGYDYFDPDLVIHINSVFAVLHQLGVGPKEPFKITIDGNETWDDFLEDKKYLEDVITFIYLRVRLIFDPPTSGFVTTAYENVIKELEWRLHIADDDINDLNRGRGLASWEDDGESNCKCKFATDKQVKDVMTDIFGE